MTAAAETTDPVTAAIMDGTYSDTVSAVRCPRPRCYGGTWRGQSCTTPNGWGRGFHTERVRLAFGLPAPKAKHRLSDAQAERLEWAAVHPEHHLYAPDQYAQFSGDAADRNCADAMVKAGLLELVATSPSGERTLTPTAAGWHLYHTHKLVIQRDLTHLGHPATCPCTTPTTPERNHA